MEDYEVKMVQRMFKGQREISLTFEQAKEMYKYEKLRDTPSFSLHHFSTWEGLDFEFVSFQKILTAEQFEFYKKEYKANIKYQEEQLIIQDEKYKSQLKAAQDLLDYYLTVFLPILREKSQFVGIATDWAKLAYLKEEYKKYLDNTKKLILVNHFRHSKTFQPILLELSLLRHQFDCLLPNYQLFIKECDLPTKTVADFLNDKLKWTDPVMLAEIESTFDALKDFRRANNLKHVGEVQGWRRSFAEEPFNLMPVLLMDSKMYGS